MGIVKETLVNTRGRSLPEQFFPDREPVMAVQFSHLDGKHPRNEHLHTCRSYWRVKVINGHVRAAAPVTYDCWRHVMTKKGLLIHCEACLHERIVGFCREIEQVSLHYFDFADLRFMSVNNDAERKKVAGRIRQYNSRREEGVQQICFTTFPLENGRTIFLHDCPDYLEGFTLPTEKAELFHLMEEWSYTPIGKRAGHSLKKWAKDGPKVKKAKGEKSSAEDSATEPKPAGGGKQRVGYFYGASWWLLCKLMTELMDHEANAKGMKFEIGDISSKEFMDMLEDANIDYSILGDVSETEEQKGDGSEPVPENSQLRLVDWSEV